MKLPYREGDIFALPLGDGSTADAQIVACGRHTVDVVVRRGAIVLPAARVSDRALVLRRWRPHERKAVTDPPAPGGDYWTGPARFERVIATRLGIARLELPPLVIRRGEPAPPRKTNGSHVLRIARVDRFDLASLRDVPIEALSLESIADLRGIETLLEHGELRQLEMLDLWSCELGEVMPLAGLPNLIRAEIDIGGRRKNVELNRRANWAYPWPPDVIAELHAAQ